MTTLLDRLLARDASLWPEPNVSANRLGWLDLPSRMASEAADLSAWAASIDLSRVILLGMGGSSLGPAVLGAALGPAAIGDRATRRLVVNDTTHPATVAELDFDDAFVIVSSKSGTTLEPNVLLAHAWSRMHDPSRYAAITDPGTPLDGLATERGFARVFRNPPDIGGRYSVLSYFGLVPAALAGYDVAKLCDAAQGVEREEAVALGLAMGRAAKAGRDKVTIVVPERFRAFGLWIEQLIAESTGKRGTGCVPIPTTEAEDGPDRHVVQVRPEGPDDLGREFLRWEIATAICGHELGIDPFDEPNVAESKANTNAVLAALPLPERPGADPTGIDAFLERELRPGDYVSIQAYVRYGQDEALERLRRRIRDAHGGVACSAGYGPRFLHSTGQLHKGGPNSVVALQLVDAEAPADLAIPDHPYGFATLIAAQALGDHQSLEAHGRRVLRVAVPGGALGDIPRS